LPLGAERSRVMSLLFLPVTFHHKDRPSLSGDHSRIGSPSRGFFNLDDVGAQVGEHGAAKTARLSSSRASITRRPSSTMRFVHELR